MIKLNYKFVSYNYIMFDFLNLDPTSKLELYLFLKSFSKYGIIISITHKVLTFLFSPSTPDTILKWFVVFEKFKKPVKNKENENI